MQEEIQVSICCFTYNQADYIRDALEGFFVQKTDFPYEILIHDDASTDGTAEILKEYARQYPDKIHLFLEEENQYFRIWEVVVDLLVLKAKGKYVVICEGDDYWIYDRKLQKQYDFMENHSEVSLCYHNALMIREDIDQTELVIRNQPSGFITDEDAMCFTHGWYPTASFMARKKYCSEVPTFKTMSTDDEVLRNYMACRGKLYFMNQVWSVYRLYAKGAWNTAQRGNRERGFQYIKNTCAYVQEFNKYSHSRFEKYIPDRVVGAIHHYRRLHVGRKCDAGSVIRYLDDLLSCLEEQDHIYIQKYKEKYLIECLDYYEYMVDKVIPGIVSSGRKLYLYGAGIETMKALARLERAKIKSEGIIVSQKKDGEEELFTVPIYALEEVSPQPDIIVWPCVISGRDEVLDTIRKKGYEMLIY